MINKALTLKLTSEESEFLRRWVYDEAQYRDGAGPAKQLQLRHGVRPDDLAVLLAAGMPDPAVQEAAAATEPVGPPQWPWSAEFLESRVAEARRLLANRAVPA